VARRHVQRRNRRRHAFERRAREHRCSDGDDSGDVEVALAIRIVWLSVGTDTSVPTVTKEAAVAATTAEKNTLSSDTMLRIKKIGFEINHPCV